MDKREVPGWLKKKKKNFARLDKFGKNEIFFQKRALLSFYPYIVPQFYAKLPEDPWSGFRNQLRKDERRDKGHIIKFRKEKYK